VIRGRKRARLALRDQSHYRNSAVEAERSPRDAPPLAVFAGGGGFEPVGRAVAALGIRIERENGAAGSAAIVAGWFPCLVLTVIRSGTCSRAPPCPKSKACALPAFYALRGVITGSSAK
jgi:hypothetical protein